MKKHWGSPPGSPLKEGSANLEEEENCLHLTTNFGPFQAIFHDWDLNALHGTCHTNSHVFSFIKCYVSQCNKVYFCHCPTQPKHETWVEIQPPHHKELAGRNITLDLTCSEHSLVTILLQNVQNSC